VFSTRNGDIGGDVSILLAVPNGACASGEVPATFALRADGRPLRSPREWCTLYGDMSYRFSAMLHIPGDVRDAIAFYERAFGATTGWSTPPAEDMVAQLLVQGAEFWVHPAGEAIGNPPPQPSGTAVRLMLIVDDPDAVFDQAVAAGAVVRSPMQNHEYGWRDGSVVDPLGHRWEIGKPL
jgi:PhnB protein